MYMRLGDDEEGWVVYLSAPVVLLGHWKMTPPCTEGSGSVVHLSVSTGISAIMDSHSVSPNTLIEDFPQSTYCVNNCP